MSGSLRRIVARRARARVLGCEVIVAVAIGLASLGSAVAAPTGYTTNGQNVATIDLATGTVTSFGASGIAGGYSWMDLAVAPNGTLWGVAGNSGVWKLHAIDTGSGAATVIGTLGIDVANQGLAFTPDGTLWVNAGSALYRIDTATGAATLAKASVTNLSGSPALAADCSGSLYALADYGSVPKLLRIDNPGPSATSTVVGPLALMAIYNSVKMGVDANGTLWGRNSLIDPKVFTIDKTTGAATIVSTASAIGAGLAIAAPGNCVTTTTTTSTTTTASTTLTTTTTTATTTNTTSSSTSTTTTTSTTSATATSTTGAASTTTTASATSSTTTMPVNPPSCAMGTGLPPRRAPRTQGRLTITPRLTDAPAARSTMVRFAGSLADCVGLPALAGAAVTAGRVKLAVELPAGSTCAALASGVPPAKARLVVRYYAAHPHKAGKLKPVGGDRSGLERFTQALDDPRVFVAVSGPFAAAKMHGFVGHRATLTIRVDEDGGAIAAACGVAKGLGSLHVTGVLGASTFTLE